MHLISPRPRPARAFTLIELLVVVTIIAVLIAILLPSLGQAKERAKASQCVSNLRQLVISANSYANTFDDMLPPTSGGIQPMLVNGATTNVYVSWFGGAIGSVTAGTFYPAGGILFPFLGNARISGCPDFAYAETTIRPGYGPCDYAYNDYFGRDPANASLINTRGIKITQIQNPSNKAMFWDSARILPPSTSLDRTPWGYPSSGNPNTKKPDPNFHARHAGKGAVGWADGHADLFTPYYATDYPGTSLDPALLKSDGVGFIDDDNNLATDEHYSPTY